MSACGRIDGSMIDTLKLLGLYHRTGKLSVVADGAAYGFYIDRGRLLMATSTWRRFRLGQMLMQRGAIALDPLQDVLREQAEVHETHRSLGTSLLAVGLVTRDDLAAGITDQAIEIMARVMDIDGGTVLYHPQEAVPAGSEPFSLPIEEVVTGALARHRHRQALITLRRLSPSPSATLVATFDLESAPAILTDDELLVAVAMAQGAHNLLELGESLSMTEFDVRRTVIRLRERGLLVSMV